MQKLFVLLSVLGLFFLAGCNASAPAPELQPTALPTEEPTEEPTSVPTSEPTNVVDYCVDCHTSKDQLISTAKPEVEAESESSGVG